MGVKNVVIAVYIAIFIKQIIEDLFFHGIMFSINRKNSNLLVALLFNK